MILAGVYKSLIIFIGFVVDQSYQFQYPGRPVQHIPHTRRQRITTARRVALHNERDAKSRSLENQIRDLCWSNQVEEAISILDSGEKVHSDRAHATIISTLASGLRVSKKSIKTMERIFEHLKQLSAKEQPDLAPSATICNAMILGFSKSPDTNAGVKCDALLNELWGRYNETGNRRYRPLLSSYISTLAAWAKSRRGKEAALRCEAILEELEQRKETFPGLAPSTVCANIVLNAWSNSGDRSAAERCEAILGNLENLGKRGRGELAPDTTTYNTVIASLGRSRGHGAEQRAESLLERMVQGDFCQPDVRTYNSVINCWAHSRQKNATDRAEALLLEMEDRSASGHHYLRPDQITYNTLLSVFSKSDSPDAPVRSEAILNKMEQKFKDGDDSVRPNAVSYNIAVDAWAKSKDPNASTRAWKIFQMMKSIASSDQRRRDCFPDIVTYTSMVDVLSSSGDENWTSRAIELLQELESDYSRTRNEKLKPNIRIYTSVIKAIARTNSQPERAQEIIDRLEQQYESGESDIFPDAVCYNALINAYAWSKFPGRSYKCHAIYQKMLHLYNSGTNLAAKPDIITCNLILKACAYEPNEAGMDMVVQTLEEFQSHAPEFGWPNHVTYGNVLLAIDSCMRDDDSRKKTDLAEATFWQCCQGGHVSVLVINRLCNVLPWQRFSRLLGHALRSSEGEQLEYDFKLLPSEWTRYAPRPGEHRVSSSQKMK